jgi:hypothetical protein
MSTNGGQELATSRARLFTRIQIPDVTITATIALAMWAFLRALTGRAQPGRGRHDAAAIDGAAAKR